MAVWTPEHLHNNTRNRLTRAKREIKKKVFSLKDQAEQSSWARDNYVPREHRLWNGAEKFFHYVMMEGGKEELRGLKLTALQNEPVLDQLTASSEGVCAIVGSACCTYIPDNDADGRMIDEGIKNITNAINRLTVREVNADDVWGWNWFKGLWQKAEYIGLIAVSALAMILFLLCMWPCVVGMIRRAVHSTMKSSVVHQMVMYNVLCESKNNVSVSDENDEDNEMLKSGPCSTSTEEE